MINSCYPSPFWLHVDLTWVTQSMGIFIVIMLSGDLKDNINVCLFMLSGRSTSECFSGSGGGLHPTARGSPRTLERPTTPIGVTRG